MPSRVVTGRLLLNVVPGRGPRDTRLPPADKNRQWYKHPAVHPNEHDIKRWKNLRGVPVIFEHGKDQTMGKVVVGKIVDSVITKENSLYITASLDDSLPGAWAGKKIDENVITGFSIGYKVDPNMDGNIVSKRIQEVSLVMKPFFHGADITVCASDSQTYNCNDEKEDNSVNVFVPICVSASGMENQTTPVEEPAKTPSEPVVTPPQDLPKDPVDNIALRNMELEMKQLREENAKIVTEREAEKKANQEKDSLLSEYKKKDEEERLKREEEQVKILNNALEKLQSGMGLKELPKSFVDGTLGVGRSAVSLDKKDHRKEFATVNASMTVKIADTMSDLKLKNDELAKQLKDAQEALEKQNRKVSHYSSQVTASRNAEQQHQTKGMQQQQQHTVIQQQQTTTVEASAGDTTGHGSEYADLFVTVPRVKPGTLAGHLHQQTNPQAFMGRTVTASDGSTVQESYNDTVTVMKAPSHNLLDYCPKSLRFKKDADGNPVGEAAFGLMAWNAREGVATSQKYSFEPGKAEQLRTF